MSELAVVVLVVAWVFGAIGGATDAFERGDIPTALAWICFAPVLLVGFALLGVWRMVRREAPRG